jgi:hypothetical protein
VSGKPLEPAELVLKLRTRRRIAVRQVKAADQHTVHRRLDIAAMGVVRIAGQTALRLDRLGPAREDGDVAP